MHPLNQMLKYHCREVTIPNTFGTPVLLGDTGFAALLFAYGKEGALKLIRDVHPLTSWEITDYRENIKVFFIPHGAKLEIYQRVSPLRYIFNTSLDYLRFCGVKAYFYFPDKKILRLEYLNVSFSGFS